MVKFTIVNNSHPTAWGMVVFLPGGNFHTTFGNLLKFVKTKIHNPFRKQVEYCHYCRFHWSDNIFQSNPRLSFRNFYIFLVWDLTNPIQSLTEIPPLNRPHGFPLFPGMSRGIPRNEYGGKFCFVRILTKQKCCCNRSASAESAFANSPPP